MEMDGDGDGDDDDDPDEVQLDDGDDGDVFLPLGRNLCCFPSRRGGGKFPRWFSRS